MEANDLRSFDNVDVVIINGVKYRRKLRIYTLSIPRDATASKNFTGSMQIDPGVPATQSIGDEPLALALKSGNFGTKDFFVKALKALNGAA